MLIRIIPVGVFVCFELLIILNTLDLLSKYYIMKLKLTLLLVILIFIDMAYSQQTSSEDLPYYEIPDYPSAYNASTVVARMIDGLGFRYYWATEGLREEDLNYKDVKERMEKL